MERYPRRELIVRGTRVAAVGGGVAALLANDAQSAAPLGELRAQLAPGGLVLPGDAAFASVRLPWNRRYDAVVPVAVALPRTASEVRACVRFAAKHGVRLAIRAGGHSTAGQSSTTGLVLDLRRLSAVEMSPGRVRVGAGARLGAVYERLATGGVAIPAGTAPSVGLAGLTLGGGHGFLSRSRGLACDVVRAVEIVTADGAVRRCTASAEKDLFWALRGAGHGSFGVVTALELATHVLGAVTTVNLRWPWTRAAEIVEAWTAFMTDAPDALSCVLALRVPTTPGGAPTIALNGLVAGAKPDATAILAPFVATTTPAQTTLVERTFGAAVRYFAGGQSDIRRGIAVASGYAKTPLGPAGRDDLVAAIDERAGNPATRGGGAVLFALGGAVNRVDPGASAFVHRRALFSVELLALWDGPGAQAANLAWLGAARSTVRPHLGSEAAQNYADPGLSSARRAYYGANLERLVTIKRRVDPLNVFRHAQSIPVKL